MSVIAFLRDLLSDGLDLEAAMKAAERFERKEFDALERRRAKDRDRKKRLRNSAESAETTERQEVQTRARVSDYITNSENNHLAAAVAETREHDPVDDWPEGGAQRHAELILAECASPWLDRNKSPGLVSSAARLASWRRDGASWEHDVLPVIRARLARQRKPINSWTWFDQAIGETVAANRAALEIPEAGAIIPFRQVGPPKSYAEQSAAAWDYAMGKIAEDG